jgi:hypothetical protein
MFVISIIYYTSSTISININHKNKKKKKLIIIIIIIGMSIFTSKLVTGMF